jgi:uncharacterized protein
VSEPAGGASSPGPRVGGTPGGIGEFLLGLALAVAGGFLLMNQVTVSTGGWHLWGWNSFGLSLIPFILGVGLLFWNGRSVIGWLLLGAGLIIVFAGVLANLEVYFRPTSLFNTLLMLVLLAGGVGLLARSLRAH